MVELTDEEIDLALLRGAETLKTEPRAVSVRYVQEEGLIALDLANGCRFALPARLVEPLRAASQQQLESVEIAGTGTGITFPQLDVDLSVPDLLAGLFGTRSWLARQAGSARSAAKARSSRENGKKGGRPKKADPLPLAPSPNSR